MSSNGMIVKKYMYKLDVNPDEIPEYLDWWCNDEKGIRTHKSKVRNGLLICFLCTGCYKKVNPISIIISGKLIEGKFKEKSWIEWAIQSKPQ